MPSKIRQGSTYAWVCLTILLFIYLLNQWSRYFLPYLMGVNPPGCEKLCEDITERYCVSCNGSRHFEACVACHDCLTANRADFYNIGDATCLSGLEYGVLAGFAFSLFYVTAGLWAGRLADTVNRRNLIILGLVTWSVATAAHALSHGFWMLFFARVMLGLGEAFTAPPSYSLIANWFSPDQRGTASGIYTIGVYFGGALASLSIELSLQVGWRVAAVIVGGIGFAVALLGCAVVREPERNPSGSGITAALLKKETAKPPAAGWTVWKSVAKSPAVLLLAFGFGVRFWGGFAIASFMPMYFKRVFPAYNTEYSELNAFVVCVGGALSCFIWGRLSDTWSRRQPKARALIPAISALVAVPCVLGVFFAPSFWISIGFLFFEYMLAEGWMGPALSLVQVHIPSSLIGTVTSFVLFVGTLMGNISPTVLGWIDDDLENSKDIGNVLCAAVVFSYLCTALVFGCLGGRLREKK